MASVGQILLMACPTNSGHLQLISNSDESIMEGSVLVHELRKVIKIVDLLRDIGLDKQLSLPKVVVLGNQSSGKSSLLEQIVGLDFLPRGSGVVTRRPLELRMNNVPDLKEPYAEFDEVMEGSRKKRFSNFNEVRKTIDEVTEKLCGSKQVIKDVPIVLNIFSPSCPNLTIVDLPGITSIPIGDQPKNIYEITRDMACRYIKEPRSIILCVIPANADLTTSEALQVMREVDPTGQRSIGCLTKIDIMDRGVDATKILKNQEIPLRYGYVGIKNRCQQDVIDNVPVSESLKSERQFFTKSPIYSTLPPDSFSTESLTKKLTMILYQQIKGSMPEIFEEIKLKKAEAQEELEKLGPGIASTDGELVNYAWKSISSFMRIFSNSINGIKNADYSADPISAEIREELALLYREQYDEPATSNTSDKNIYQAMINFPGENIPGFPSIDAFLALQNPLLKKLQTPAYSANNKIHELMDNEACRIINEVMIKKFPEFNSRFTDLVRRVLEEFRKKLEAYLNLMLDAELNYLYTNDSSYLMGDFVLSEKEKKKLDTGKIKDPLIFELRKRIDSYYRLVVRNLRDLVPRQIFNFLIVKCLKQLEFEAFQFTSDVNKLKQLLNEPEEIRLRRQQCVKSIKVFEESEKRIRMDPDIAKLIRNTQKESKYYQKFGIKSPEEQEKEAFEAMNKSMLSQKKEPRKPNPDQARPQNDQARAQNAQQPKTNPPPRQSQKQRPQQQMPQPSPQKEDPFAKMFGEKARPKNTQSAQQPLPPSPAVVPKQPSPIVVPKQQSNVAQPYVAQPYVAQPNVVPPGRPAQKPATGGFSDFWGVSQPSNPKTQPVEATKGGRPEAEQKPEEKKTRTTTFNQLFGLPKS